jgi:U3 small nucleolar RNA-associated protein 14
MIFEELLERTNKAIAEAFHSRIIAGVAVFRAENMPRLSNGRSLLPQTRSRPTKKNGPRNHALSALAIAEKTNPERNKIRRTRLGEVEDDGPRQRGRRELEDENGERATKRRKTGNAEEDVDGGNTGSDSEGNKWHVGMNSNDEDSDLDSDNALGESDEERFEGFAFRGSITHKPQMKVESERNRRSKEIDLSEGEDDDSVSQDTDEDDDLGEDAVDLAAALDLNLKDEEEQRQQRKRMSKMEEAPLGNGVHNSNGGSSESASDENDEDSGLDEDAESDLAFSDDDGEPADTSRLLKFVEDLQGPTAEALPTTRGPSNVPNKPSDFGVKSARKLTLADLKPTVKDPSLMRSLKMLHNSEKAGPQAYRGGIPGKLEPPLAKRHQDRLDRAAAYEKSKETLNRWVDTVKQNRRAEHISFPLPDPDALSAPGTKELMPATQSQPLTSLEATIQNIMQESGLTPGKGRSADDQAQAFEELQERKMPIEEVQARRAELRKARELMFREEVRARRIKKIKSKSYRRVHRKEREKMAQEEHAALDEAGFLNSDEERERNDRRRAKERMGARHRESKWAKGVKASGRAAWDEDARRSATDLTRRDEELRRRIEGKKVTDSGASELELSSSDSEDDLSSFGSDGGSRRKLQEKLEELDFAGTVGLPQSKLAGMAFMKKAEASRKAANDAKIEQLRQELGGDGMERAEIALPESVGRLKFGSQQKPPQNPKAQQSSEAQNPAGNEFEERFSEDEEMAGRQSRTESEDDVFQVEGRPRISALPNKTKKGPRASKPEISGNPWIESTLKFKENDIEERNSVRTELIVQRPPQKAKPEASEKRQIASVVMADETSSSVSDDEDSGRSSEVQRTLTRNEEMVKMMFAGDDVFEDFDKEKRETIEDEGDQVIDNTLPGWGNWTGTGISKREQKRAKGRFVTTIKGMQEDKRKDAKLDKVIVNEKRVKKVRNCRLLRLY